MLLYSSISIPISAISLSAAQNLADSVRKPNFRFHNTNWQLWQTTKNNYNNNNKNNYNKNYTILEEPEYLKNLPDETADVSEETAYDSYYTQYTTPDSMDCGSDNLLVTFDYGYSDSIEPPLAAPSTAYAEDEYWPETEGGAIWFGTPPPNDMQPFKVHHVQHKESLQSLISYDVDDFEEQSESDHELGRAEEEEEEVFYDSIESWSCSWKIFMSRWQLLNALSIIIIAYRQMFLLYNYHFNYTYTT